MDTSVLTAKPLMSWPRHRAHPGEAAPFPAEQSQAAKGSDFDATLQWSGRKTQKIDFL